MNAKNLGRLRKPSLTRRAIRCRAQLELREAWSSESTDFTPSKETYCEPVG